MIAGDVGGTKTLLALYLPEAGARKPVVRAEFHSADYSSLDDIVREFISESKCHVEAACFDVAGPVIDGQAVLTNLPWVLDEAMMQRSLGLKQVILLNDLKAVAYAVPHLLAEDVHTINQGRAEPDGPMAVIAPGTGLGEAFLVWNGNEYLACSSEGGHADFAPTDQTQAAMLHYLSNRFGHVAYERVCSGSGLPNVYDFLRDTGHAPEPPAVAAQHAAVPDRTPLIIQAAL
ncbi:MAG: glucokinase, partial [Pseudomonadota bacterium]|nr:glucokinase [Pseudomonadota bacterium]